MHILAKQVDPEQYREEHGRCPAGLVAGEKERREAGR